ncbi:MAG: DUF2461 family protein [Eubacteriales bacterium]|nr:DUF2461 family protein [Eubacteriales bacterium]
MKSLNNTLNNTFTGFTKELLDFLFALRFENTIEKQTENLKRYKLLISEPLKQLYETLLSVVVDINATLETKPSRCISSPYTDRRFSTAMPLKEYMYIRFKQNNKDNDIAGLYFDMGMDYYSYGLRIYKQTSAGMQTFRDKVIEKPKPYLKELEKISAQGFSIIGDSFKKDHYPDLPQNILKEILNRKCFYIGKDVPVTDKIFTPELAEEIANGFIAMSDLLKLLTLEE